MYAHRDGDRFRSLASAGVQRTAFDGAAKSVSGFPDKGTLDTFSHLALTLVLTHPCIGLIEGSRRTTRLAVASAAPGAPPRHRQYLHDFEARITLRLSVQQQCKMEL